MRQNSTPLTMLSKEDLDMAYKSALEAMRELNRKGVAYESLSREFDDPVEQKLLRNLGLAAGILQDSKLRKDVDLQAQKAAGGQPASMVAPVPAAVKLPPKPATVMPGQTVSRLPGLSVAVQPAIESSASPTRKISPVPALNKRPEVDRQTYLERLAAAKNKRIASARPSQEPLTPAQPPPPSIPAQPSATSQTLAAASSQNPPPAQVSVQSDPRADTPAGPKPISRSDEIDSVPKEVSTPTKANPTKTDLVRQRLEALKRQAQEKEGAQQNTSDRDSPQISPLKDQQNSGSAAEKPTTIQSTQNGGSVVKESVQSFHLPGLTTTFSAAQPNDGPSPSPPKSAVSLTSESISESARSMGSLGLPRPGLRKRPVSADFLDTTSTKKPYAGPIMQEETCVIELSDDESEGEIDDDEIMTDANPAISRAESFMPPLTVARPHHVPRMPRAEFHNPDSLREATEKVEAEKRALLDRIARAEKRQREKASNAATPVQTPPRHSPIREQPTPPVPSTTAVKSPAGPTQTIDVMDTHSDPDAYQVKLKKQAELDAAVASNQSKMEELRRQMQALEEENRQKMQDRDNLARELQRLGVDTAGMSHSDLQATKDRIENQIAQNDVVMEDVDARTEAGAEASHRVVEQNLPASKSQDDVSVQRSDLEEGEWRSSEIGNSPPETLPPLANLPTSHPVDLSTGRPGPDASIALDEIPSQDSELTRILQRPHTANSLSSGEIIEDSPMILDLDEPEQEIIQGPSNDDVFAKTLNQEAIELSTAEGAERRASADESNDDEDYEPELTINDSAPTEAGPLTVHHAVKACQDVMGLQSLTMRRTKRRVLGLLRTKAR
jgi:hypothetical protein